GDRPWRRLRAAPAARHSHRRRAAGLAMADALHHAGDLSLSRPRGALARPQPASCPRAGGEAGAAAGRVSAMPARGDGGERPEEEDDRVTRSLAGLAVILA